MTEFRQSYLNPKRSKKDNRNIFLFLELSYSMSDNLANIMEDSEGASRESIIRAEITRIKLSRINLADRVNELDDYM